MPPPGQRPSIIIIDDDPDFRKILKDWLSEFDVHGYSSGETALQDLPKLEPDLIILDVRLPGVNGFAVSRELRRSNRFAATPVLFLTANGTDLEITETLESGGSAYLSKPVERAELLDKIKLILSDAGISYPGGVV